MATAATVRCEARAGEGAGHTVAHRISPCLPGREMGAGGMPAESVWVSPCRRCGRGGGRRSARVSLIPRRNAGNEKQGGWSVRDRGGGTRSPSPSAPPPMAISPRSSTWGDPGEEPDTAVPLISPCTAHAPREGAGEERRRRGRGGGCRQKRMGIFLQRRGRGGAAGRERMLNRQEGAGKGCQREVRWLECGRQGRGNEFPLPVSPSPRGDIPTVQHMGRSRRKTGHGFPSAPPRIRFPAGSTPDTISRRLHPGYGCSPDIASTAHAPGAGGVGGAGRSAWVSASEGAGGVGVPARSMNPAGGAGIRPPAPAPNPVAGGRRCVRARGPR
ncbi:MAG: hypothetical protein BWX50_00171 [Euryarchaeota archaeon ADurb.Bin009]|nr:MAG: hypothetical protein BWX50_00171 [Euryarchaeota archaeon ADurb.Bin009]